MMRIFSKKSLSIMVYNKDGKYLLHILLKVGLFFQILFIHNSKLYVFHILDVIYKQEVIWYKSIVAIYVYINANEMNTNLRLKCFPRIKRLHQLYTQPFFVLLNCCYAANYIEGKKVYLAFTIHINCVTNIEIEI